MTNESNTWTACRPREITDLASRLHARRMRRVVGRGAAVAAVAIVVVAVWFYPAGDPGPDFAGISCQRVSELSGAYLNKELAPRLQDQIGRHIALCPECRRKFDSMTRLSRHRHGQFDEPPEAARLLLAGSSPSSSQNFLSGTVR